MHPLEAQTVWLLGAASAGDKEAEKALNNIPEEALADIHRPLLTLVRSLQDKNGKIFKEVFGRIFGTEIKNGDRATCAIIKAIEAAEIEWAVRSIGFATVTLPTPQLIERLEGLAKVLKDRAERPATH